LRTWPCSNQSAPKVETMPLPSVLLSSSQTVEYSGRECRIQALGYCLDEDEDGENQIQAGLRLSRDMYDMCWLREYQAGQGIGKGLRDGYKSDRT
jgi:hypothetical protein